MIPEQCDDPGCLVCQQMFVYREASVSEPSTKQAKAGVALPAREVRELTLDEIDDVLEQPREFNAFVYQARDLMQKFCDVNGLTIRHRSVPPKTGVALDVPEERKPLPVELARRLGVSIQAAINIEEAAQGIHRNAGVRVPVAWYDPTNKNPGQSVTFDKAKHEKWPHIYRVPLYADGVRAVDGGQKNG